MEKDKLNIVNRKLYKEQKKKKNETETRKRVQAILNKHKHIATN